MGFFPDLSGGAFKTSADGRHVFYPWGMLGRGYELESPKEYRHLRIGMNLYVFAILLGGIVLGWRWPFLVIALIGYAAWAMVWAWRHKRSSERLTEEDVARHITKTVPLPLLGLLFVLCLFGMGIEGQKYIRDPSNWLPLVVVTGLTVSFGALFLRARRK